MNGIERITARIEADAQGEIDALLASAQAEVAEIEQDYQRRAEALRAQLLERSEKAALEREERLISAAKMEGRKALLAAR